MTPALLLIEDDAEIAEMVAAHLRRDGYMVSHAADGAEAVARLTQEEFGLILLDLMLPGIQGLELLKRIRTDSFVPVLILSAKDTELDKALGLGFGADDYLTKPFSLVELTARVQALLRRANDYVRGGTADAPPASAILRIHELELEPDSLIVRKRGTELHLTAKELLILKLLMENPGRAFTKEHIYREVWQDTYLGDVNAVQVQISRLRDKIEDDPQQPGYIRTIWGIGYKLGAF